MIEGLKVTIQGPELRDIAMNRAAYHAGRVKVYDQQIASMKESRVEAVNNMTNGDPVSALESRRLQHFNDGKELEFIAQHIDQGETYLLDRTALERLGIVSRGY